MLVRVAVTLCWEEAEEVSVVAAAPVTARTTTRARTMFFMMELPLKVVFTSKIFRWTCNRSNHRMNPTVSRMESVIY
jgi:hypothetical protein